MRLSIVLCMAMVVSLLLLDSCTKHYANTVTATKPAAVVATPAPASEPVVEVQTVPVRIDTLASTLSPDEQKLLGSWKLLKIEAPQLKDVMVGYGTQADREETQRKTNEFISAFQGFVATFNSDHSFSSVFNEIGDIGKWTLDKDKQIEAVSSQTSEHNLFKITSINTDKMVLDYKVENVDLVLTMTKMR